jgi:hypothetical protein
MSESTVSLYRSELEDIAKVLKKFPEAESLDITVDNSSGIGKITDIVIPNVEINGATGDLKISITGVDHW